MNGLVTVVVPIYKVEKYLERCLHSIVNQTYRNLEILLIDDGSPDRCPQMCDEWASKDKRIKTIHKTNEGAGMARNTGIDHATGEFICFFDSDDYVSLDTIQLSYKLARKENADAVLFGMNRVNANGSVISRMIPNTPKSVYSGSDVQNILLPGLLKRYTEAGEKFELPLSGCCMMLSTEVIQKSHWRFRSERECLSEDPYFLLGLYNYLGRVAILREASYFYCINTNSLTQTYKADRFDRNKDFYKQCIALCESFGYGEHVKRACAGQFMGNTILAMKQAIAAGNAQFAKKNIKKIIEDEMVQNIVQIAFDKTARVRLLFWAIRNKNSTLCCIFVALQNILDKHKEKKR